MGVGHFGVETEGVSSKWNCILYDIMIFVCWELDSLGRRLREWAVNGTVYCVILWLCMLGVGQFGEETEGVSSKWNCVLCDIMICVCWELDSLGRRLRGWAVNGTVYCVILWFVYVGCWTVWGGEWGVSSKWNCILCDIMICVCWELDSLVRRLRGEQ